MSETKKMLVAFDPARLESRSTDFLVPWKHEDRLVLLGLKSKKNRQLGLVVYTGRAVSEKDLFARIVDLGLLIPSVDKAMDLLRLYNDAMRSLKSGSIVRLHVRESNSGVIAFELVANSESSFDL